MLVDCLMQVYRIGFLVTSLPVNCNSGVIWFNMTETHS